MHKGRREVEALLESTGLDYEIKDGGKHNVIKLAGEVVGCFNPCHGGAVSMRAMKNLRSQIRRRMKTVYSAHPALHGSI